MTGLLNRVMDWLASNLNEMFVIKDFSFVNKSSNTWYIGITQDITLAGYTPIALKQVRCNKAAMNIYSQAIDGTELNIGVASTSRSGTISGLNVYVTVVYVRSPFAVKK